MTKQYDTKGEMRAAFTLRELENARRSIPTGTSGVFIRVTLAIIFMYLIVIAYSMMGATGAVLVSVMFLVAFFVPSLYLAVKNRLHKRSLRKTNSNAEQECPQKG